MIKNLQIIIISEPKIYFITTKSYKQQMGAGKSRDNIYYDPTVNAELFDETKQCKFYRNQKGEEFEKYRIRNSGNNDFQNRYEYRIKHNSPYLVDAFSAKTSQNAFGCTSGDQYQVVTQRIPIRLCDINNLPGPQALNMVHKALKGFHQIYKSQGVLLVKDSMIGVNQQNHVKVWMNSNYAINQVQQPPISYGVLSDYQKQSTLVDNIIQLINSRSRRDHEWVGFVDQKYRHGRIGFDQAIQLSEIHSQRNNVILSDNNSFIPRQSGQQQHIITSNNHQQINNQPPLQQQPQFVSNYDPQGSVMKNTTQTITSSINPYPISSNMLVSASIPSNPINKQISQPPNLKVSTGMSNIRNKIINKNPQINQHSNFPITPNQFPQPQITPNINNLYPQPPPLFQNRNSRPPHMQSQNNRPRVHSQGKPIITFGNRPYAPSNIAFNQRNTYQAPLPPQNLYQNQYKLIENQKIQQQSGNIQNNLQIKPNQRSTTNLNSFSIKNQIQDEKNIQPNVQSLPQVQNAQNLQQVHNQNDQKQPQTITQQIKKNAQEQNNIWQLIQQSISKNQKQNKPVQLQQAKFTQNQPIQQRVNQNQQQIQSYQSQPQRIQLRTQYQAPQVSSNITISKNQNNKTSSIGLMNKNELVNYPPPNQVTNFEEITDNSKHKANPQMQQSEIIEHHEQNRIRSNELQVTKIMHDEPKIRVNEVHSDVSDDNIAQNQIKVQQIKINRQGSQIVQKSQSFGVSASFGANSDNVVNQTLQFNQTKVRNEDYNTDSPMFGKSKQSKVSKASDQSYENNRQTHIDQLLALQEEKLQLIRSKEQSAAYQKSLANSKIKKQSQKFSQKQSQKQSQKNNIPSQNQSLANSKKQNQMKKSEPEANFKNAVKQTANNIRLETSKISIRSSSDLKGIISYKDLRDLLKSTKKP